MQRMQTFELACMSLHELHEFLHEFVKQQNPLHELHEKEKTEKHAKNGIVWWITQMVIIFSLFKKDFLGKDIFFIIQVKAFLWLFPDF